MWKKKQKIYEGAIKNVSGYVSDLCKQILKKPILWKEGNVYSFKRKIQIVLRKS